jgi:hypothetical protein
MESGLSESKSVAAQNKAVFVHVLIISPSSVSNKYSSLAPDAHVAHAAPLMYLPALHVMHFDAPDEDPDPVQSG